MGKKFLKCQREDCEWNIGWYCGLVWTEEPGKGTRICNLGARAMVKANAVPPDNCPQSSTVAKLAHDEFEFEEFGDGAIMSKTDRQRRLRILYILLGALVVILCTGLSLLIVKSC
jgi:hypothetical protein